MKRGGRKNQKHLSFPCLLLLPPAPCLFNPHSAIVKSYKSSEGEFNCECNSKRTSTEHERAAAAGGVNADDDRLLGFATSLCRGQTRHRRFVERQTPDQRGTGRSDKHRCADALSPAARSCQRRHL